MSQVDARLEDFMNGLARRNPGEPEFHQAVGEVATSIIPFILENPIYEKMQILERMTEPDRIISFRVCWQDDDSNVRVNRGYRVQFNNAIGPYKGGLRFHPGVTQGVLKFLGFEQQFKNSLTGLPIGGGKGGANFNPRGKSDGEVMRFCQSFMTELYRYIGPDMDVPAGDIGVGGREIGYMFGQYKKLTNRFEGVLTGKNLEFGGSRIRPEATGYGTVYFLENMLNTVEQDMAGATVAVSGSGNVATFATQKAIEVGARVITLSDSDGFVHDPDGIDEEKLAYVKKLKGVRRGRISEYADEYPSSTYYANERPWRVPCDFALPCATQNEIDENDANTLVGNGVRGVSEGANMPSVLGAVDVFLDAGILYGPAKAANAGGVAISGLEMSQNSSRVQWKEAVLQEKLCEIMDEIHARCLEHGKHRGKGGSTDYVYGANVAGFLKVANAMLAYGVV